MKILVTGGAGYLGSILVPELLKGGYEVTVIDSFMYGEPSLAHVCSDKKLQIVRGDVRSEALIGQHLKSADAIIPLAAYVGAPLCDQDPVGAKSVNHDAVLSLFKMLSPRQYVIMPTTNSAYGSGGKDHACDETSPLNPISSYARDKVEVESALMTHPNAVSLRLATVFGMSPRMRIDLLVNDFTYRAVTDHFVVLFESHFKRNYIHVRDVASVMLHCLSNFGKMQGQIYNVGLSDANISKLELCERIKRHVPDFVFTEALHAKDQDQRNYIVSNSKIQATGWKPGHSLDDGIAELVKGYAMIRRNRFSNV